MSDDPIERQDRAPEANLTLLDATMIGMGAMIGAGIFVLTGLAAELAGPAAIVVSDAAGDRVSRPDTVLQAGEHYLVAVESDVADEVMNLLRG